MRNIADDLLTVPDAYGYPCEDVPPTLLRRDASSLLVTLILTCILAGSLRGLASTAVNGTIDGYFGRRAAKLMTPEPSLAAQIHEAREPRLATKTN